MLFQHPSSQQAPSEILARSLEKVFEKGLQRGLENPLQLGVPRRLAVACSGGSDSLALLLLCQDWMQQVAQHPASFVAALICDHRQRASSTSECEALKRRLEDDFGLAAFVFAPEVPLGSYRGNLQQNMRLFRLRKFLDWCLENEVGCLALGHTRDDQLETHMLQEAGLLRGRGGMREFRRVRAHKQGGGRGQGECREVLLLRPLLQASKASLQAWLREREPKKRLGARQYKGQGKGQGKGQDKGVAWLEDPSNLQPCYARNRLRPICAGLSRAEQASLLARCVALQTEEEALEKAVRDFMQVQASSNQFLHADSYADGYICVESGAFLELEGGVALRVLANMARSVGGRGVRTREVRRVGGVWRGCLEKFLRDAGKAERERKESAVFSLGRCLLFARGDVFFATRSALRIEVLSMGDGLLRERLWDGRFLISISSPISSRRDTPSACAVSFVGWTCEALGRAGVVGLRRSIGRALAMKKDVRLEREFVRFEKLPWRVREVLPSFWSGGEVCVVPSFGIVVEGGYARGLSGGEGEGLPCVRFADIEERNLLLPSASGE